MECEDAWAQDDIEKYGLSIISSEMSDEEISEVTANKTSNNLLAYVDVTDFKNRYSCAYKKAAARWRVQLYKPQKTAIILVDVFNVMWDDYHGIQLNRKSSKQYSLRLDYGKWRYMGIPAVSDKVESGGNNFIYKYDWTDNGFDFSVDIPQLVIDKVMAFLQELAGEEFGFVPTIPANMPPARLLKYFTLYPLDVNVGWYVDMLGYDFAQQVLRTNDSNFEIICDYLDLPKTKGLQKAYRENGFVLLICYFLKQIGITDVNMWSLFYNVDRLAGKNPDILGVDRVGTIYSKKVDYYSRGWGNLDNYHIRSWWKKQDKETQAAYDSRYVGWQLLYRWLMEKWEPQKVAEILRGALLMNDQHVRDCLYMWFKSYVNDELKDDFVQAIYRYGFSKETHDIWTAEERRMYQLQAEQRRREENARHKSYMDVEFTMTKGDLMKEEETPQGSFKAARSGKELFELSEKFHNCVFYLYTEKASRKECTIYYLEQQGEPVACIEVSNGAILQALGDHNHILTGEIKDAVIDWSIRNNLEFKPLQ
ncbi:hypothetical protein D081_1590 [Anaerovibrio sp. JC8]|nr:hypothetical protein D081_1590 [Anaerovibrio sp. JC8]